jgi:tRNA-dihydrouridine synthase
MYEVKKKINIKVIGNGDLDSGEKALTKIKNLDGVMAGRGAIGNPWLLSEIYQSLQLGKNQLVDIPFSQKIPAIIKHVRWAVGLKGERLGILEMRKHLGAYIKGFPGAKEIRNQLVRASTLEEVISTFNHLLYARIT